MSGADTTRDADVRNDAATVDLRPLARALARHRSWILIGAALGIAAGLVAWATSEVRYEAVATLVVSQPRSGDLAAIPSTASYAGLVRNHTVVATALQAAGLELAGPYQPALFLRRAILVEEVPGTNLIRIRVRQASPELAARIAHEVATAAVALSRAISSREGGVLRDQLQGQIAEAAARLEAAQTALLQFQRESHIDLVREEVEGVLEQERTRAEVEAELSASEARAAAAARELAARPPSLTFERSIDYDPVLTEAARARTGNDASALLGLALRNEESNPAYEALDEEVALARARVAELAQQRQQIVEASAGLRESGRLGEFYAREAELARLEADAALARRLYDDVAERYEQARVVATSGSPQLQIVDDATAVPDPVSWSAPVWIAAGALGGLVASLGMVLLATVGAFVRGL